MIYSHKYDKTFRNRSELMRHEWRDRQTRPILPWWGLRDSMYSDGWKKEHEQQKEGLLWRFIVFLALLVAVLFLVGR